MYEDLLEIDLAGWEWEIRELDRRGTLTLAGDLDLTYHWEIEIRFDGCEYVALPTSFADLRFALATFEEEEAVRSHVGGAAPALVIALTVNRQPARHLVAAQSYSIVRGLTMRTYDA